MNELYYCVNIASPAPGEVLRPAFLVKTRVCWGFSVSSAHKIKLALGRSYFVFALLVGLISNGRRPRMTSQGRRRGWLPIRRGYV